VSAADLADAIAQVDAERIFVARALDPLLRKALRGAFVFEELPFVRGRTVVPEELPPGDIVVAGHPNYLGVFDLPAARWVAVTGRWSSLQPVQGSELDVEVEQPAASMDAAGSFAAAIDLAKRLDQLRGVTVAFQPASPVVVALLPIDPASVAAHMAIPGCTALGYGELPGGLRMEVGSEMGVQGYADALERALTDAGSPTEDRWTQQPAP